MGNENPAATESDAIEVDLRNPNLAALLAWLLPGAGHLYQRRYGKGMLFMICILTTYFFGLALGDGHVVYASWTDTDIRWQYICQLGVGLPALPALEQSRRVKNDVEPLFGGLMAPPEQPVLPDSDDELASWHQKLTSNFEMGTLYTMIAGLLNVLVIYDAFAGPFVPASKEEKKDPASDP